MYIIGLTELKMELYYYDGDDNYVCSIKDHNSIFESYNRIIELKNKPKYHFKIRLEITPISFINIIIYDRDINNINSYLYLINFSFKVIDDCKNKLKFFVSNAQNIRYLIVGYYTDSYYNDYNVLIRYKLRINLEEVKIRYHHRKDWISSIGWRLESICLEPKKDKVKIINRIKFGVLNFIHSCFNSLFGKIK